MVKELSNGRLVSVRDPVDRRVKEGRESQADLEEGGLAAFDDLLV